MAAHPGTLILDAFEVLWESSALIMLTLAESCDSSHTHTHAELHLLEGEQLLEFGGDVRPTFTHGTDLC